MTTCAIESSWVYLEEYQADSEARGNSRWQAHVERCRGLVPALTAVAEQIETSWYDLSEAQQAEAVKIWKLLREQIADSERSRAELSVFARIAETAKAVLWGVRQSELMPYIYASVRFLIAVDRALANEARRRRAMDEAIVSDPELREEISRGQADFEAGRRTRYSSEEFGRRFLLT